MSRPEHCGAAAVFVRFVAGHERVLVVPVISSRVGGVPPGGQADGSRDHREAEELRADG